MSRSLPGLGLTGFWGNGIAGWDTGMDTNLRLISALTQGRALGLVGTLPGSPSDGDIYLLDGTAGADAGKVAIRDNGAWVKVVPQTGWRMYDVAIGIDRRATGTTWVAIDNGAGTLVTGISTGASAASNATAIQAAIDALYAAGGGILLFPAGVFSHSGVIFKNKIQYRGKGRDTGSTTGTVLLYTGIGDGVQINNPINSSTAANISVEGITFKNANRNAGKGCFADTGSTDLKFRHCAFIGSDRGLILDQSELVDVNECDFEGVASQTTLAWLLNGADRTVSASGQFTNRIKFEGCQFNGQTGTVLIADDGGNAHSFTDNNYNGGLSHIRAASVIGLKISGGELESATGPSIRFDSTSLAGTGVGSCGSVYIGDGVEIVPGGSGQYCILAQSLGSITLNTVYLGNTTAAKFGGTGNVSAIYAINCFNGGGGATFDGRATNHWEVGDNGTLFAVRINVPIQFNGVQVVGARQTGTAAVATDPATTMALVNDLRAKLITHGLIS